MAERRQRQAEWDSEFEKVLVEQLHARISQAVGEHVSADIDREEYVNGLLVHTAAQKGLRVPLGLLGLEDA